MARLKSGSNKFLKSENNNNQTIVLGVLAGTLLGAGAALFLASKAGRHFREEVAGACSSLTHKACDLKDSLVEQGEDLYEKVHDWVAPPKTHTTTNLVLGGLAGGVLGATAIYFACHPGNHKDETLMDKAQQFTTEIKDKTDCWISKTKDVLDKINSMVNDTHDDVEEEIEPSKQNTKSNFSHFLELANLGFRLYNSVKQGR